jgi:sugar phosphate isomerase/epimerase
MLSRRTFLGTAAAAGLPLVAAKAAGLKIGAMDGVLKLGSRPEACALARRIGLEGVQVTLGQPVDGHLPLEDAGLQARWVAAAREHGIRLDATYIDVLHADCLKDNARARDWVRRGLAITGALGAPILMTVFFGKCAVSGAAELDTVAHAFHELAPEAEAAGVILGFENLLDAEDNLRVWDRVGSRSFKVYYDVGNSTRQGYDVPKEIRRLGRDRICQFHFKDGQSYLGQGTVRFPAILDAIGDIGFTGFANLETASPSGDVEADARRNLDYLRGLLT